MGLILSPLFVLVFVWLNEGAKKIANKYLFFSLYNVQETMARLTDELTNSIDLSKIVDSIVNSIKDAMQLDRAGILLIDQKEETTKYKIAKVIGFNEHNGISLVQDNFLTQHLEKTQRPLVLDELQMIVNDSNDEAVKQNFNQLAENMKHIEASLCVPMIISNKLIGIIVLGAKVSGDAYTSDDLNLLGTLAKQAAIAIDNARLYEQVQDFNKTLQQKVDEQTQEIKKAYEIEKQANQELKQLDEAKTQFILITQHHLRTPLSVNMGFLDLLKQGSYGKVPAKMRKPIKELIDSTQKEIRLVDELLDVSSYQLGTKIINLKSNVDVSSLIKETLKDLKIEAENKGIYLKYKKRGVVPETSADSGKLKMALTNIVDNCVKYTKKGGVSIILKSKDNKILIDIEDTGMGMTQEQLSNLFGQTFQRGQEAQKIFAVGKGIGLFLSAKIIEGHNGKIFAESKGEGEGSTFHIELPVV
jgi:signal transduction histidine kinase